MGTRPAQVPELIPVAGAGIADLFPDGGAGRMEASGVLALDDGFLVVFDDSRNVGVIGSDLSQPTQNRVITPSGAPVTRPWEGFEDIACDPVTGQLYLLVEAAERDDGGWMGKVEVCDKDYRHLSEDWLAFPVPDGGKGMEGWPASGAATACFCWQFAATCSQPPCTFTDYAGISVTGDRIVVVSQESSAIWIGGLDSSGWQITDPGTVCEFPRDNKGRIVYCLVEGVSWLGDRRLVACSDRAKSGTPGCCRDNQQSVHIFDLP